jgi:hypothetical protein
MNLLSKVSSFAAWHEAHGHLASASTASSKRCSQFDILGGAAFAAAAQGQPEQLCSDLSALSPILQEFYSAQTQSESYFPMMVSHLMKLPVLQEDIKAKTKYTDSVRQRVVDHENAYSKASRRLNELKTAGPTQQAAFEKAKDQYEIAFRQHQTSLTVAEEQESQYARQVVEYKGLVVSAVLRALEQFAVAKARTSRSIAQSALRVRQAAEQIRLFDQWEIETLEGELQALRAEAEETSVKPIRDSPTEFPDIRSFDDDLDDLND